MLNGGVLSLASAAALGSGSLNVTGASSLQGSVPLVLANAVQLNAALSLPGTSALTLGGVLSGTGTLDKVGADTLTLNGSIETVVGGAGADNITFSAALTNVVIDAAGGTDTLTLRNDGNGPLSGIAAQITGTNAANFTLTTPLPTTLDPGQSSTFTLRFTPAAAFAGSSGFEFTATDTGITAPTTKVFDAAVGDGAYGQLDVDLFRFEAGAGTFVINVSVDARSPNLNVEATLLNSEGGIVAVSSPSAAKACSKIRQLSVAFLFAETIRRITDGDSVTSLFSEQNSNF
mgnify:CR=1 FL=1